MAINEKLKYHWSPSTVENDGARYLCAHCSTATSPRRVWRAEVHGPDVYGTQVRLGFAWVAVCSNCLRATFESPLEKIYVPSPMQGAELKNLPDGIRELYDEARWASSVSAFTASVMAARKLLMNLAVVEGADEGLSFKEYVDYLEANGFVPPKGKAWVDKIRKKGNEANHEIKLMSEADCADTLKLAEMLLRFNFELIDPPST